VREFYTPEEKSSIATLLDRRREGATTQETISLWIPAANAAGLKDREALWCRDILLHGGEFASTQLAAFEKLESERMDYATLAETLDTYAQRMKRSEQPGILSMAATAWRNAGNRQREILDLRELVVRENQQQFEQRLFDIYLHGNSAALLQLTTSNTNLSDPAANYLLANGTQAQAYTAVANRAESRPPVWKSATSALVGLYFGDTSPEIDADFQSTLANDPIGQRLQSKPDQSRQLVGNPWFYYGHRYGFFLTLSSKPSHDPEDYLPAALELSSSNPASYFTLAKTYFDARKIDAAIGEYRHITEIDPTEAFPNIAIARALWSDNRHDAALVEWREALTKLRAMVDLHSVPESFWTNFAAAANDANAYQIGRQLKPSMDVVLRAYIRKNGNYRSTELLHSAYIALENQDTAGATEWVLSLTSEVPANDQLTALEDLNYQDWIPRSQYAGIYRREIALAEAQLKNSSANQADRSTENYFASRLTTVQTQYINWLLENDRAVEAERIFESIGAPQRKTEELQTVAVLLAAKQSRLPALLAAYTSDPSGAPSLAALSSIANTLRLQREMANSRLLLEYVFQQKLQQQALTAPDYLALAEARISTHDLPGALDLLNRLTLQGDLYENLDTASSLLIRTGHPAEALPMLEKLANGTPWRADYLLRLGQAQLALKQSSQAANSLTRIASNDQVSYASRANAANDLHAVAPGAKQFSSAELTLLTTTATAPQADYPYFVYARIATAPNLLLPQRRTILRAAIQTAPDSMLNWLRLRIFQTEIAQNHYEQAQIAIAPVLEDRSSLRFLYENRNVNGIDNQAATDSTNAATTTLATAYTVDGALASLQEQHEFVLSLASIDEHLGNDQQAIVNLQSTTRFTSDTAEKSRLELRIKAAQRRLEIAGENTTRRPVISNSIEENILVQPRIPGATAKVQP
jgi:cellulose synthase operon protein C